MTRHLHSIALGLALLYAAPSFAQFQGLDLSGDKKRAAKKKKPASGDAAEKSGTESEESSDGNTDWTQTTKLGDSAPAPASGSSSSASKSGGSKPTMSFDAVDVSGKSADRIQIEVEEGLRHQPHLAVDGGVLTVDAAEEG
ncbi:MAG TPA: hypothetical protein VE549_14170, partial [Myxococcaceae bacterium]|nr:hypothetical protein [Myxococcaceae bacterium]